MIALYFLVAAAFSGIVVAWLHVAAVADATPSTADRIDCPSCQCPSSFEVFDWVVGRDDARLIGRCTCADGAGRCRCDYIQS